LTFNRRQRIIQRIENNTSLIVSLEWTRITCTRSGTGTIASDEKINLNWRECGDLNRFLLLKLVRMFQYRWEKVWTISLCLRRTRWVYTTSM
jgi:hypothetical protein